MPICDDYGLSSEDEEQLINKCKYVIENILNVEDSLVNIDGELDRMLPITVNDEVRTVDADKNDSGDSMLVGD